MDASTHFAEVSSRYSASAEAYRVYWAGVLAPAGRRLVEKLPIGEATRMLDLGAGVGTLLPELAAKAPSATVVAADLAIGMIQLADDSFPRVVVNASKLCFRESVFDAAVMAFMLFHLPDPLVALSGVRHALKPGGVLGVATWETGDGESVADQIVTEELDRLGAEPSSALPSSGELMDTSVKLAGLLGAAGLVEASVERREVVDEVDLEGFLVSRTHLGVTARRFGSLPSSEQTRCVGRLRTKLSGLAPAELTSRDVALLAVARKPDRT